MCFLHGELAIFKYSWSNVRKLKQGKHHSLYKSLKQDIKATEKIVDAARKKKYPTSNNAKSAITIAAAKTKAKFDETKIGSAISSNAEKQKSRRERDIIAKENMASAILSMGQALNSLVTNNNKKPSENQSTLHELKAYIRAVPRSENRKMLQTALLIDSQDMLEEYCCLKESDNRKKIENLVEFASSVIEANKLKTK